MPDYNTTVRKDLLPELLSGENSLAKLIESVFCLVRKGQHATQDKKLKRPAQRGSRGVIHRANRGCYDK